VISVSQLLANGTSFLPDLQQLIFVLAALVGLVLLAMGLLQLATGDGRGQGLTGSTIALLVGGALLVSIYAFSDAIAGSLFSADSDTAVVEQAVTSSNTGGIDTEAFVQVLLLYMVILGWIAVFRGILFLANGPRLNQPGWVRSAIVFTIAGVLLINFRPLANTVGRTFTGTPAGDRYFVLDQADQAGP
tara:strand:+ start:348 stop:914 length:567 start_codon:yes stop_codon:yes gene_type:complete